MNAEIFSPLNQADRLVLLGVARHAIEHGLAYQSAMMIHLGEYAPALRAARASFVTLHRRGELCGCIGSLEPCRSLVEDVAHNAHAAAFEDPRFTPVTTDDLPVLAIHISILHPARAMSFTSEADLLSQLKPGVDGLILEAPPVLFGGRRRGTFLPSVWETLPEPEKFWQQLKRKAGLPELYWSDDLKVWRYRVESVE